MPLLLILILTLLVASAPAIASQVTDNPSQAGVPTAAPVSALDTISAEQVRKQLPQQVPSIVQHGAEVWWEDGKGTAYRFAPVSFVDRPLLDTAIGRLPVTRKLIEDNRLDALAVLPQLIAKATEAGLHGPDLELMDSMVAGIHLRAPTAVILPEGLLTRTTLAPAVRSAERDAVEEAVEALLKTLPATSLDDLGRRCTTDFLKRIPWDNDHKVNKDEVSGNLARRLVVNGWFAECAAFGSGHKKEIDALLASVKQAQRFVPITAFEGTADGKPLQLAEVRNAFEEDGWILTTPVRCTYMRMCPSPMYHWAMPDMNLVVDLPVGSDPTAKATMPIAARIYHNGQQLASWSKSSGLTADLATWRKLVPARSKASGAKNVAVDFLPPSIPLASLVGEMTGVISEGGVLLAPRNATPEESERFLSQASQLLPDAAHLDLIGEYLFSYVYDSPDSRFPWLIGNRTSKGDIHQTATQTISDVTGGTMRGDCDDIAELYEVIADRQGRTAHVISLPEHAACAWAEKKEDGQWHVFVLQTGPAFEFIDKELPSALEKAYKAYGESEPFDANGIGLLLRFSGENTRSGWRLSWRIFAEPEYARTMIDVQKDWHFETYQRGIKKMLKLIADGDNDNANYRELAGLYSFTGQYDSSVAYYQKAIALTADPASKLNMSVEMVQQLIEGGKLEEAKSAALDILDRQLPPLRERLGLSVIQLGARLAAILSHKLNDVAVRTINETMLAQMAPRIDRIGEWLESKEFNQQAWDQAPQFLELRRLTQIFANVGISVLKDAGQEKLPLDSTLRDTARSVQGWLNQIAFRDIDDAGDAISRYAAAGEYYAAILGQERFTTLLESAEPPRSAVYAHQTRIGGLAQLNLDLPWIQISVPYWFKRLTDQFDHDRTTLDGSGKAEVARYGKHLEEAYLTSCKFGIEDAQIDADYHLGRLLTALVAEDMDIVGERLHYVADKNDKRIRDQTAQWLGDIARFLPLDWYKKVMGKWKEELNYKPKYFMIAWRAALNSPPPHEHALLVAEMAANEFKDDPAFTEEFEFMKKVLDPTLKGADGPGK